MSNVENLGSRGTDETDQGEINIKFIFMRLVDIYRQRGACGHWMGGPLGR